MALKYPLENQDRCRSKIQFQAYKVIPPEITGPELFRATEAFKEVQARFEADADGTAPFRNKDEELVQAAYGAIEGGRSLNLSGVSDVEGSPMKLIEAPGQLCSLYLPISYSVNDGLSYETPNLGFSGSAALAGVQEGGGVIGSIFDALINGLSSTFDLFNSNLSGDTARLAASRLVSNFPFMPEAAKNAIPLAVGVTLNPNVRAVFRGVALREFTFQFKFIPKSQAEAEEVKKIVQYFRKNAYPEDIPIGGINVGYKFPNMFKIKLMHQASSSGKFVPVGTQIKLAYIRAVQTNYNPTAAIFHSDGNPTEIDISLSFVEYRTISRRDLDYDYTDFDPDLVATDVTSGYEDL